MSATPLQRVGAMGESARSIAPGILTSFTIAAAATFLSEHYTAPVMLFALLLGMAFHFLAIEGRCVPGINFTSKRLLRVGVALLGVRVTLSQIFALGVGPITLVVLCVAITIGSGLLLARLFGRKWDFGLLTGGAVAICGASAALAISSVLPKTENFERDTLFTVIAVTALSTLAMIVYPIIYLRAGFDHTQTGILIGATIHDVAQVVGAGFAISPETGDVATYVKLLRVAMLPIVVIAIALLSSGRGKGARPPIPGFAVAFAIILLINSTGVIPPALSAAMQTASTWLLVAAIAALGMKTSLRAMFALGPGHILVITLETLILAVFAVTLIHFL